MSDLLISELTIPLTYAPFGNLMWTIKEEQRLMNSYPTTPRECLLNLFPDRTWVAIKHRARILMLRKGPRRWTEEEQTLLEVLTEDAINGMCPPLDIFESSFPDRTAQALRTKYYRFVRDGCD